MPQLLNETNKLGLTDPGICLRIGAGVTNEFKEKNGALAIPNIILENRFKDLAEEKESLLNKKKPLSAQSNDLRWKIAEYKNYEDCKSSIDQTQNSLKDAKNEYIKQLNSLQRTKKLIDEKRQLVDKAPESSTLFTTVGIKKTKGELLKELEKLKYNAEKVKEQIIVLQNRVNSDEIKLNELRRSLDTIDRTISNFPELNKIQKEFDVVNEQIEKIEDRIAEIDDIINRGMKDLFENCNVIGTTVYKTYLDKDVANIKYDTVVVDEASMSLLPLTYFSAGKANKRVLIVGDFNQLPAIISASDNDNVLEWIKKDPFEKFEVRKGLRKGKLPNPVVGLRVQNRMSEQINNLVSKYFYNNRLECSKDIIKNDYTLNLPFSKTDKRILYIDTALLGAWSSRRAGKGSLFNITSAALVAALIDKIHESSLFSSNSKDPIGVVTPYAAQRELLIQILSDYHELIQEDSIGTAHRFQGSEKEIIIFDIVVAHEAPSRFINAGKITDDATKLLNVALSRAKKYIIFIGDFDKLINKGGTILNRVVKYIKNKGEEINGIDILKDTEFLDRSRSLSEGHTISINVPQALFTENLFYPVLKDDLNNTKKSVVIYSAFMTTDGLTRWFPYFAKMLSRNIRIKIVTRTLAMQPNARKTESVIESLSQLVSLMRSAGIIVNLNREIHEKVIIIDNRIVWHGSLNMLSQNPAGSSEFMVRTDSEEHALGFVEMLTRHDFKKNDIIQSDYPCCPCCSMNTELRKGFKGVEHLYCESCDWQASARDFWRLSPSIPIGFPFSKCPEIGCSGTLKLRTWGNKFILGCSSFQSGGCKHKEDVKLSQLNYSYEPFPLNLESHPNILNDFKINEKDDIPKKDNNTKQTYGLRQEKSQLLFPFNKNSTKTNNNNEKPIITISKKRPAIKSSNKPEKIRKSTNIKKMSIKELEDQLADFKL